MTFTVPTERDASSTVKLQVTLPAKYPLAVVLVKKPAGWSYQIKKAKLNKPIDAFGQKIDKVVRTITWTAGSKQDGIKPGEFDEFVILAGPLPKADQIYFKAVQTYDNGEVARWDEVPTDANPEPQHPAPVLKLVPATE